MSSIGMKLRIARYSIAGIGFFLAFSYWDDVDMAILMIMTLVVAPLGLLAGLGSVFFVESVAAALGWKGGTEYQTEVGFFNMAIGSSALITGLGGWSLDSQLGVLLVYILYLSQALCLHSSKVIKEKKFPKDKQITIGMMVFLVIFMVVFLLLGLGVFD